MTGNTAIPRRMALIIYISALCPGLCSANGQETILTDARLKSHTLTVNRVQRVVEATKNMNKATKDEAFQKEFLQEETSDLTLDELVKATETQRPIHSRLIRETELTVHDYFLTFTALLEADALNRQEEGAEIFRPFVNPENLTFVRANAGLVKKAAEEIEELNRIKEEYRQKNSTNMDKVNKVVIEKAKRKLTLVNDGQVIRSYKVALGKSPIGPKTRQGDGKTPEGKYTIDAKLAKSRFYRALRISYPNSADRDRARSLNVSPGGDIEIHGLPPKWGWIGPLHRLMDWTDGCIAVTNKEITEIWEAVPVSTDVEIKP